MPAMPPVGATRLQWHDYWNAALFEQARKRMAAEAEEAAREANDMTYLHDKNPAVFASDGCVKEAIAMDNGSDNRNSDVPAFLSEAPTATFASSDGVEWG